MPRAGVVTNSPQAISLICSDNTFVSELTSSLKKKLMNVRLNHAEGGSRTRIELPPPVFETGASANSATSAFTLFIILLLLVLPLKNFSLLLTTREQLN